MTSHGGSVHLSFSRRGWGTPGGTNKPEDTFTSFPLAQGQRFSHRRRICQRLTAYTFAGAVERGGEGRWVQPLWEPHGSFLELLF